MGSRTEDEALARLYDEGERAAPAQVSHHGEGQVHETSGPVGAHTLVVVHGGYFRPSVDRTHARPMARALAAQGWRVVLAEYRRVPGSPFTTTDDLTALDAHLAAEGHDVAAWVGHSAGGALVLWRALTPDLPPTRAVALAPVADLTAAAEQRLGDDAVRDWIGAGPEDASETYDRLDPDRLLATNPAAAQRVHLVHGDRDDMVPVGQTEGFAAPSTILTGAHHVDLIDPVSAHWQQVLGALRSWCT